MTWFKFLNEKEVMDVLAYHLPKAQRYAMADSINRLVYLGYREIETVVAVDLTRRNKGFVSRSRGYKKTRGTIPVDSMIGRYRTLSLPRSTGWVEQDTGGIDRRKRKWKRSARGKGGYGTVKPKYRLKKGAHIVDMKRIRERRLGYLMRVIEGRKYFDRPVSIPYDNANNLPAGLVVFKKKYRNVNKKRMREIMYIADYERNRHVEKVDIIGRAWKRVENYGVRRIVFKNIKKQLRHIKV
ncbi:MAG: hypothetical protein PVI90_15980 [Desulfobacteraceae bacterium]|jgi:hypothetical protein